MDQPTNAHPPHTHTYNHATELSPEFRLLIKMVFAVTKEFLYYVESKYVGNAK